jgi:hypothetical protein
MYRKCDWIVFHRAFFDEIDDRACPNLTVLAHTIGNLAFSLRQKYRKTLLHPSLILCLQLAHNPASRCQYRRSSKCSRVTTTRKFYIVSSGSRRRGIFVIIAPASKDCRLGDASSIVEIQCCTRVSTRTIQDRLSAANVAMDS